MTNNIRGDIFLAWPSKSRAPSLKRVVRTQSNKESNQLYTLLVVDQDAPYPENAHESPLLMHLRVNIGYQQTRGHELVKYNMRRTPGDIVHRYIAIVFIQEKGLIDIEDIGVPLTPECFAMEKFAKCWGLRNYLQCFKLTN
jgi:hypothetical protein